MSADARFSSNSRRTKARAELRAIIVTAFAQLSVEEVVARLDAAQIANARMNDMRDVWAHPQLRARKRWAEVATQAGPIPALVPPGQPDAHAPRIDPIPALGEHSEAILRELGHDAASIARLRQEKVI